MLLDTQVLLQSASCLYAMHNNGNDLLPEGAEKTF
jgi:hypothetical protein